MRHYEVTFIVDPVLSGDEIKSAATTYVDHLKGEGSEIVHINELGLRELAYPINKRNSGVYYCVEFTSETGDFIPKLELAFRRDERIMRFLTVKLDKYGVKYNADKRAGLINEFKPKKKKSEEPERKERDRRDRKKEAPAKEAPAKEGASVKEGTPEASATESGSPE
ncbi:MAG: 30S ribosomal protein S6 [Saprospiraceae bacterium]|jgi:small subunit ribosomal protein S6